MTTTEAGLKVTRVTREWLEQQDACKKQVSLFAGQWPDGADVTAGNLRTAARIGMEINWFAEHVLPLRLYAGYRAKCDALHADYRAKCDALHAAFGAKRDAVDADYRAKCAELLIAILGLTDAVEAN